MEEYNRNRINKVDHNPFVFYRQLKRKYGDEVDLYFSKGYHSSLEYKFYNVLEFYFPNVYIELGHSIGNFVYDFCIGGKIIIEFDGTGFYHSSKKQKNKDKEKESLAVQNGYIFFRVTEDEFKSIEFLNKIKECLN